MGGDVVEEFANAVSAAVSVTDQGEHQRAVQRSRKWAIRVLPQEVDQFAPSGGRWIALDFEKIICGSRRVNSLLVAVLTAGQSIGGALRPLALLLPRGRSYGDGPNDFQVNRTAASAGISLTDVGARWRLSLTGGSDPVLLDPVGLAAMPQHTAELPLACVEGWSVVQRWSGVRLRDLAARAGVPVPVSVLVRSVERAGAFSTAVLTGAQALDPDAMLATHVNGAPLSLDHGFPARVVVPALPGVHCTKWVRSIEFRSV
jgi:Oxidoreductase molybdopterin binding domain